MATDRHAIDFHVVNVDGHFAYHLCAVTMEKYFARAAHLADLLQRLHDADLVVDSHDGDQASVRPERRFKVLQIDEPVSFHGKVGYLKALGLQLPARVKDALVLCLRGNDVALPIPVKPRDAFDCHVVGLCRAGGEDNLLGITPYKFCDLAPRVLDAALGVPTVLVRATVWVPVALSVQGKHGVEDPRVHGRGGLVVQVGRNPWKKPVLDGELGRIILAHQALWSVHGGLVALIGLHLFMGCRCTGL